MAASVKKTDTGYDIVIKGETITLPIGSTSFEKKGLMIIGTDKKQLQLDPNGFEIQLFEEGKEPNRIVVEGGDEKSEEIYDAIVTGWDTAQSGARRRSRLNRKTRRSKRNGRHTKHRKLRKLSTRRR